MNKLTTILLALFLFQNLYSQSDSIDIEKKSKITIGFEIDALPYLTGGYYGSVWLGLNQPRIRLRPVIAQASVPAFMLEDEIEANTLLVYAFVADYFFKPDYKGFWVGTGMEFWDGEVENISSDTAAYEQLVFTVGGGYVWKFWGNLYFNPWVAGHLRVSGDSEVLVGNYLFEPPVFTPEASLKIGWHF